MSDVRALLKEQQAGRRIQHPHVTYSTTGRLICLVCNLQLKSESLWAGHQRSPNHKRLLAEAEGNKDGSKKVSSDGSGSSEKTITQADVSIPAILKRRQEDHGDEEQRAPMSPTKKRKAQRDFDESNTPDRYEAIRKRSKSQIDPTQPKPKYAPSLPGFLPEGFFDAGHAPQEDTESKENEGEQGKEQQPPKTPAPKKDTTTPPMPSGEFTLASRPLTPMDTSRSASRSGSKPLTPMEVGTPSKNPLSRSSTLQTITSAEEVDEENKKEEKKSQAEVDEDEWAAFEADIAAAEAIPDDAVISAAPVSAEELANMTVEETYLSKRERLEREREQEKEDIINKALDEQEEMKELEARVNKLKARTEEVKKLRVQARDKAQPPVEKEIAEVEDEDDDSDLEEDDDDWLRG